MPDTDALGLREEVAEVLARAIHVGWCNEPSKCSWGVDDYAKAEHLADALLPLIERREAEAAERALRDAADEMSARLDTFPQQGRHTRARWAEIWLRDRANQIGGTQ